MNDKLLLHTVLSSVAHEAQGITCFELTFKSEDHRMTFETKLYGNDQYPEIAKLYNQWFTLKELLEKFPSRTVNKF